MVFFVLFRDTVSPSAFGDGTLRCDGVSSLVIESICYKGDCYRTNILDMFCHRPVCWWYPDGPDFNILNRENKIFHICHIFVCCVTQKYSLFLVTSAYILHNRLVFSLGLLSPLWGFAYQHKLIYLRVVR